MMRDPIGLSLLIIGVALLCLVIGAAYWFGGSKDRATTIQREKGIADAIHDADSSDWRERLQSRD